MSERDQGTGDGLQPEANVTRSIVGSVKGHDVHLSGSAAGLVAAEGNLSILNGGCGPVLANGDVSIHNGGCGPLITNGDASIENGGTQAILAAGGATIGGRSFVGFVISPKVTVEEGGRVMFGSPATLALAAGTGIAIALLSRLVRR